MPVFRYASVLVCLFSFPMTAHSFMISPANRLSTYSKASRSTASHPSLATRLWASNDDTLPEIDTMKAKDMKQELQSYGVSTSTLLEKSEFKVALKKARAEAMTPKPSVDEAASGTDDDSTSVNTEEAESGGSREERYQKSMEEAKAMKVGDLKKELNDRGIPTGSFLEKSEFIKAYAGAIADNKPKKAGSKSTSTSSKNKAAPKPQEPDDPSYQDVVIQKFDRRRLMGQAVIDISL